MKSAGPTAIWRAPVKNGIAAPRAGLPALAFDLELGLVCVVAEETELVKLWLEPGVPESLRHGVGRPAGGRRPGLTDANLDSKRLDEVHVASLRRSLATPTRRTSRLRRGVRLTPVCKAAACGFFSSGFCKWGTGNATQLTSCSRNRLILNPPIFRRRSKCALARCSF